MALKHALLGLLTVTSASGYDLLKDFQQSLAQVWPATQSQVYSELARLSAQGLVAVSSEGARRRKEYSITDTGRRELHEWMVTTRPVYSRRSDMLLRVFFLDQLTPGESTTFFEEVRATSQADLNSFAAVRTQIESIADPLARNGLIALEYGERLARMQREWADWAISASPGPSGSS